jgi:hypothetical protein
VRPGASPGVGLGASFAGLYNQIRFWHINCILPCRP